jgi:glycosyltransferase involved in cell wall biosynthesis
MTAPRLQGPIEAVSSLSDRPLCIGVVPVLDGSSGGIYQYSVTMLEGLLEIQPRPKLVLFAESRYLSHAEVWRKRGYQIASLWPRTARWRLRGRLRASAKRISAVGPLGRVAARLRAVLPSRRADTSQTYQVRALSAAVGQWIRRFGVDFLVFPAPSPIGFESGVPYVIAVHDLQHRLHPEFPEVSANGEWESREYLFRNGIENALTVLVDSEVGREDVLNLYGDVISSERTRVLPFLPAPYLDAGETASNAAIARERLDLPERFLFFPAQFWPHKNHVRVVQALARIRSERGVDVDVVMCGSASDPIRASVLDEVHRTAAAEGVEDLVHILGYVEDDLMAPLYAASRGVLLPTFFGPTNIPILEAWGQGRPVLSSDLRGIREQCGEAAVLVDPTSVPAIAEGIHSLWSDDRLRRKLVAAGTRRLALYGHDEYNARLSKLILDAGRRIRGVTPGPIEPDGAPDSERI